jgi:hypothetical protein
MHIKILTFWVKIVKMNKAMKLKKIVNLVIFSIFFPIGIVMAKISPISRYGTIVDLLNGVVDFLYNISFLIAPLMIIIAGFFFVTSGGDDKRITKGRDILLYAGVGFLVIVLARGAINLIAREFGQ